MKKFPKQIFVTTDLDGKEEYLVPWKSLSNLAGQSGEKVAIYELKFIKKVEVKVSLK